MKLASESSCRATHWGDLSSFALSLLSLLSFLSLLSLSFTFFSFFVLDLYFHSGVFFRSRDIPTGQGPQAFFAVSVLIDDCNVVNFFIFVGNGSFRLWVNVLVLPQ